MVSPLFPPSSFVGAKRALHFARNTPKFGWEPAVVCLPSGADRDPALEPLVPDVPVLEALRQGVVARLEDRWLRNDGKGRHYRRAAPPGGQRIVDLKRRLRRFVQFPLEKSAAYIPSALSDCVDFMKRHGCEVIYVNASPFSALVLGALIHRRTGAPLVLDLRDPWSIEPNYRAAWGAWQRAFVDRTEAACFRRASSIVLNTEASRDAYRAAYAGRIPSERFTFIRNHFDPELYEPAPPRPKGGNAFRIAYYGHLRPAKNGGLFLRALAHVVRELRLSPADIRFEMFGERTDIEEAAIGELGLAGYVHEHEWVPFFRIRPTLSQADVLLDLMGSQHHLQISGKIYDYFAVGARTLSVSTNPEIGRILDETGMGSQVDLDVSAIAAWLSDAYRTRGAWVPPDPKRLEPYQAQAAARKLTELFETCTSAGRSGAFGLVV
jgi:glycosyltransferase involved in cell wall biosynthesis